MTTSDGWPLSIARLERRVAELEAQRRRDRRTSTFDQAPLDRRAHLAREGCEVRIFLQPSERRFLRVVLSRAPPPYSRDVHAGYVGEPVASYRPTPT